MFNNTTIQRYCTAQMIDAQCYMTPSLYCSAMDPGILQNLALADQCEGPSVCIEIQVICIAGSMQCGPSYIGGCRLMY